LVIGPISTRLYIGKSHTKYGGIRQVMIKYNTLQDTDAD